MLFKVYNHEGQEPLALGMTSQTLALGLAGGMLAHGVYGLTDAVALGAKPGFLWWYLLALITGLNRLQKEQGSAYSEQRR
jgi:hypothetical protein